MDGSSQGFVSSLCLFALGAFGSMMLEFLKIRQQYGKMPAEKFHAMMSSPMFWIFSGGLVVISGFFTIILFSGEVPREWHLASLTGGGVRSFGREALGAAIYSGAIVQGGSDDESRITLRDILS